MAERTPTVKIPGMTKLQKTWAQRANQALAGMIVDGFGFDPGGSPMIVLTHPETKEVAILYAMQDDECNGPGSIQVTNLKGNGHRTIPCIPTVERR